MNEARPEILCIACSIFRCDLEALRTRGDIDFPIRYLDSMLHMQPSKLHRRLQSHLEDLRRRDAKVLLLYGECHDYLHETEPEAHVWRVRGRNCFEILLGSDRYRTLRRQGVFFLLPEWLLRWREVFEGELGLTGETARDFMREMHTKLLYLDTGRIPVPVAHLEEASEALGLPWEVLTVDSDHLLEAIRGSLERMEEHER